MSDESKPINSNLKDTDMDDPSDRLARMLACAFTAHNMGVSFNYCWRTGGFNQSPVRPFWIEQAKRIALEANCDIATRLGFGEPLFKLDDEQAQFIEEERRRRLEAVEQEVLVLRRTAEGEVEVLRQTHREELAHELRTARRRLVDLKRQVATQTALTRLFASSLFDRAPEYPPTPGPMVQASQKGLGLPSCSGIYFVWSNGIVVYVGQSVNIANRARSNWHDAITADDHLSWLAFEEEALNWAESFYIGIHRPIRNFGGAARLNCPEPATAEDE